jgi:hypothetical protein
LDNNLHAYVTAACAARVSLLASSPPAAAEIVYTPANSFILPKSTLSLDLNHDGTVDFQFSNLATKLGSGYSGKGSLAIRPANAANLMQSEVKLEPLGVNFGDQKVGTKSSPIGIELTNVGATSLSISGIAYQGYEPRGFFADQQLREQRPCRRSLHN